MSNSLKLPHESLRLTVDLTDIEIPEAPRVQTTILGQPRAQSALEFGVAMQNPGYNIFVMGDPGTGRLSMITNHLDAQAQHLPAPPSYAYVDNFENPREPIAIELPPGQGHVLSKDIEKLIDNLLATFPAAFESPSYQQKKSAIERHFNQRYNSAIDLVDKKAQSMNIALFRESDSVSFSPIRDNKSLDEDQFTQLPQPEREAFHKHVEELEEYLGDVLLELPQWRRLMVEKIRQLDNDTINQAIDPLFSALDEKYQNIDDAITFLSAIKKNLNSTIVDYLMPGRTLEPNENALKRSLLDRTVRAQYSGRSQTGYRRTGDLRAASDLPEPVWPY